MSPDLMQLLNGDGDLDERLTALMPLLCRELDCDRCALFLRDPETLLSRMTHAWARAPEFELAREDRGWTPQSPTLVEDDPMFAEALVNPEALYIEDIETADPALVNAPYEREHFGHRALVHAPLFHEGAMYGILEPCVFGEPRIWTVSNRETVSGVQRALAPLAARYVAENAG